ncbi:hypothetical protein LINGRAHAP2_LOCUS4199 [Linum grandiflorum]
MLTNCRNWHMSPSVSRVPINFCSGLLDPSVARLPYGTRKFDQRLMKKNSCWFQRRLPGGRIWMSPVMNSHVSSSGRNYADESPKVDPLSIILMKKLRTLLVFLVEQPSQLKHLEWPGFQSTLRTATLTLVLVALLIVALSSVDSILCYLLALFLRRSA